MRTVAVIQARMGSERLPDKVLTDIAGEPMLARVVNRVMRATCLDEIVIATTETAPDNAISVFCESRNWHCFRGNELDVLDRYYTAAKQYGADAVIRITADCPLIDPGLIDSTFTIFKDGSHIDYASNTLPPRSFPRGLDVEVMSFSALERAWKEDQNPTWREHVTPYLYNNPDIFKVIGIYHEKDLSHIRWTVDTPEDLTLVRLLFNHIGHDKFSWNNALDTMNHHPEWHKINHAVMQKSI
jgi:spore coat polysaccharide biosynthesis protein SpsF